MNIEYENRANLTQNNQHQGVKLTDEFLAKYPFSKGIYYCTLLIYTFYVRISLLLLQHDAGQIVCRESPEEPHPEAQPFLTKLYKTGENQTKPKMWLKAVILNYPAFLPNLYLFCTLSPSITLFVISFRMSDPTENSTSLNQNLVFTPSEFESISKYLIGSSVRLYPNIIVPQSAGPARIQEKVNLQK